LSTLLKLIDFFNDFKKPRNKELRLLKGFKRWLKLQNQNELTKFSETLTLLLKVQNDYLIIYSVKQSIMKENLIDLKIGETENTGR